MPCPYIGLKLVKPAVRKALHAIVAAPNSGWDIVGAQRANKLGLRQPIMDDGMGETTCPFQEAFQIAGSKFAATPVGGCDPVAAIDG